MLGWHKFESDVDWPHSLFFILFLIVLKLMTKSRLSRGGCTTRGSNVILLNHKTESLSSAS